LKNIDSKSATQFVGFLTFSFSVWLCLRILYDEDEKSNSLFFISLIECESWVL